MSKFKVGDRVAFTCHWSGTISSGSDPVGAFLSSKHDVRTVRGKISAIKDECAQVERDAGGYSAVPLRILRRLKPRKRREWWISVHKPGCRYLYSIHSTREEAERTLCSRCNTEAVLVREARSGEGAKK